MILIANEQNDKSKFDVPISRLTISNYWNVPHATSRTSWPKLEFGTGMRFIHGLDGNFQIYRYFPENNPKPLKGCTTFFNYMFSRISPLVCVNLFITTFFYI